MRKNLVLFIVIINSIFVFGQTKWKSINDTDFTVEYPENWELNRSGLLGTKFIVFSKLSSSTDKFRENVNLIIQVSRHVCYDV